MKEVTFEIAKILKEVGYNEYCLFAYNDNGKLTQVNSSNSGLSEGYVSAPLYISVSDWLRTVHNIYAVPELTKDKNSKKLKILWRSTVRSILDGTYLCVSYDLYDTYEEAFMQGILFALEYLPKESMTIRTGTHTLSDNTYVKNLVVKGDAIVTIPEHYPYKISISCYDKSVVDIQRECEVNVYDNANVTVIDSKVIAHDCSYVDAKGRSLVTSFDKSEINAKNDTCVHAYGYSIINAYNFVNVWCRDKTEVHAKNNAKVYSNAESIVFAYDNVEVEARGSSKVYAHEKSKVKVIESASVEEMRE